MSVVLFNLYPTCLHKWLGETIEDFGLYYKDNVEPVNNFHPKNDKVRRVLWKGQPVSLDDVSEKSELVRILLMWCREEMMRDWIKVGHQEQDEKLLRDRMETTWSPSWAGGWEKTKMIFRFGVWVPEEAMVPLLRCKRRTKLGDKDDLSFYMQSLRCLGELSRKDCLLTYLSI